jgi:hypothetical protein
MITIEINNDLTVFMISGLFMQVTAKLPVSQSEDAKNPQQVAQLLQLVM